MATEKFEMDLSEARAKIGKIWGFERELTRAELARALRLSPVHGGDFVSKLEKGTANLSGPIYGYVEALLEGYVPPHMKDIVKPGYPRGAVR